MNDFTYEFPTRVYFGHDAPQGSSNVLVAYYSAQGHTRGVAQTLAQELGADLFEIVPEEPYTSGDLDWNDPQSRVSREHDDPALRAVALAQAMPDDLARYDTVYLGYPIWWGVAAWPTNGFVEGSDLTGKTVVPFCTSSSSELGESASLLAELAGAGAWREGKRFADSASADEVREWVRGL